MNLADSAGYLTEDGVKARISVLTEKLCIPVGFHAHNNLGLAIANSLAAISEGASYIDGSLRGLGAGAGNAQIEVLQAVLQRQTRSSKEKHRSVAAPLGARKRRSKSPRSWVWKRLPASARLPT